MQSPGLRGRDRDRTRQKGCRSEGLATEGLRWGVTMLADWSIRAPRETPGGPLNFNFPKKFRYVVLDGPVHCRGRGRPDEYRYGDAGQRGVSATVQHARYGVHVW